MARFSTPGVYIKENNAFSNSVVSVPTAVPAFIGYTEKASRGTNSITSIPTRVNSFKEYLAMFGKGSRTTYTIKAKGEDFDLIPDKKTQFNLYNSVRLFYANGGGSCFIISMGNYSSGVKAKELREGLDLLVTEQEPTMICIPDAILLERDDCYALYRDMLTHCGKETKNRMAILDVYNGDQERTYDKDDVINQFRDGVGHNWLAYGASYYPYLNTTVVGPGEVSFKNISNHNDLVKILTTEAENRYFGGPLPSKSGGSSKGGNPTKGGPTAGGKAPVAKASAVKGGTAVATATLPGVDERQMRRYEEVRSEIVRLRNANGSSSVVDQNLKAISPMYNHVLNRLRETMNVQPTCGIMAGVYTMVDSTTGVHKSPANVGLNAVLSPTVAVTAQTQEDLNLPVNGKAVNAIRSFVGKGVLPWGARTMDGNSQDWRYINVRRTLIYIEQSVKAAVENYVFEPNTPQSWLKVKISIENFLTGFWKTGALLGISPAEAYEVAIGLGDTMTPEDVLDGMMRISVFVSVARPAEFVEITFEQRMLEPAGEEGDEEGDDEGGEEGDDGDGGEE